MPALLLALLATMLALPALSADDCEPSRWGAGDEIGNANLITPDSVLAASKLVTTGKTYPLGIVIDSETPAFAPARRSAAEETSTPMASRTFSSAHLAVGARRARPGPPTCSVAAPESDGRYAFGSCLLTGSTSSWWRVSRAGACS